NQPPACTPGCRRDVGPGGRYRLAAENPLRPSMLICGSRPAPASLLARSEAAADQARAGSLRDLDELLRAAVPRALSGTGMPPARPCFFGSLRHARALLTVRIVSCEDRARQREQAAYGGGENCGL